MTAMPESGSIRILIAEDDDNARALLVELLNTMGHVVVAEVSGGREAIERAKDVVPDVVLLRRAHAGLLGHRGRGTDRCAGTRRGGCALQRRRVARALGTRCHRNVRDCLSSQTDAAQGARLDAASGCLTRARIAVAKKDAKAARDALENRKTIERAKGILMRRTGSSEQEAYRILQRTSQDRSVPMVEIARAVLASEPGLKENMKDDT